MILHFLFLCFFKIETDIYKKHSREKLFSCVIVFFLFPFSNILKYNLRFTLPELNIIQTSAKKQYSYNTAQLFN